MTDWAYKELRKKLNKRNHHVNGLDWSGADLVFLDLEGFEGIRFNHCDFSNANMQGADLRGAEFFNCEFTDTYLRNANMVGCTVVDCRGIKMIDGYLVTPFFIVIGEQQIPWAVLPFALKHLENLKCSL